jgi:hypothetical protein
LAWLPGCSSDYSVDFYYNSAPPDDALIDGHQIRIHEGIAVGVDAHPIEDGERMDTKTLLHLVSEDLGVLGIASAISNHVDVEEREGVNWSFVIFGVKAGSTTVTVFIDGEREVEIPAVVEPQ